MRLPINRASEIRLRAERRLGELLKETPKAKPTGSNQHKKQDRFQKRTDPTLADAGISRKLSSRAQELAAAPVEQFEEALNVPADRELNPNRVVKDLKEKRQRDARQEKRMEAAQRNDRIPPYPTSPCGEIAWLMRPWRKEFGIGTASRADLGT